MAGHTGLRYSFTDAAIDKRGISDAVFMLDWKEIPLLAMFGMDSATAKFRLVQAMSRDVEVIEDKMRPFQSILATALADGTGTAVVVTAGEGVLFREDDIIKIEDESMRVTAVATDTLTVVRGYGETTGVAHAQDLPILLVTRAVQEGEDYKTGFTTLTSQWMNHTQIISESVRVTKTDIAVNKWGVDDELDYQVMKLFNNGGRAGVIARFLANTFYHGTREQRTASLPGAMGGFNSRLAEIPDSNKLLLAGAAVTRDDVETVIRGIRDNDGTPDILVTNSWGLKKLSDFYADTIQTTRDETIGGHEITQILTPSGTVSILYDWLCPQDQMYFVDRERVGWHALRPFEKTDTVELGDRFGAEVVGEYTFLMTNPEGHGRISGMDTTS